jgi:hypothetical protein
VATLNHQRYCENINYCTYGTRTVATLNQHVTVRTYCTYGTRTMATLNHQHVTVRTLITVHMVPGLIECSHCPGTICTVINVLTVTC